MSDFVYLYGFVPAETTPPDHLAGIGESAVHLLAAEPLRAVVSHVPASEYSPQQVEARLEDLEWVAEQGVAHERVVAWFVDHAQILPAPLFTMYSSVDALRSEARERMQTLTSEMTRLRGLREWDLKVFFDERVLEQHAGQVSTKLAQIDDEIISAPAGKRYLLQKKRSDVLKAEVRQGAHQRAISILNSLTPLINESRALPLPRTGDTLPVVLHAALLVGMERESEVVQRLELEAAAVRPIGMDLAFSGPWAPYRFMGEHE